MRWECLFVSQLTRRVHRLRLAIKISIIRDDITVSAPCAIAIRRATMTIAESEKTQEAKQWQDGKGHDESYAAFLPRDRKPISKPRGSRNGFGTFVFVRHCE
jgi:hypothetical protein